MTPTDPTDDERLAALLAGLTERFRRGEPIDLDLVAATHPDLGPELRELWTAFLVVEELAVDGRDPDRTPALGPPLPISLALEPSRVFGPCELIEVIGRGGMGVVYRARQPGLDRDVALKRLIARGDSHPQELARFRREAAAAARLDHPHIVPVYHVDEHDGEPYFLMKLVDGTTLARRLADGPLPPREAAELLVPIGRAVAYAHSRGVLHRDLKPSNILIDRQGIPHVSDFGLAKRVDRDGGASLTQTGAILGTPSYMAPEQADGRRGAVGPASDVYGLGAILYQMLTGRPPFQAASPVDTLLLVLEQDPVPPRVLNPRADPDLEMIALKCLQKPPELRYPDAGSLADDLDAYLAGAPISARSTSPRVLFSRLIGETHNASILENWGLLWMCHGVALVVFFGLTSVLQWRGVTGHVPYLALFTVGMGAWAAVFWSLRHRAGPVTFVERQIAHLWGAGVISINLIFAVEWLLGLPALSLASMMAVTNGMIYFIKAGMLSGLFYFHAGAVFLTTVPMALYPRFGPAIFGGVSALLFFGTGLKYHRQRVRADRLRRQQPEATVSNPGPDAAPCRW